MTFWQAIQNVLTKTSRPMTAREILERAVSGGLIVSHGKTPLATLTATLYEESKRDSRLQRIFEQGPTRAKRGTVRWTIRRQTDYSR
jgi:HB1/ASXL restriction endonuclease-like protein with HTH domain